MPAADFTGCLQARCPTRARPGMCRPWRRRCICCCACCGWTAQPGLYLVPRQPGWRRSGQSWRCIFLSVPVSACTWIARAAWPAAAAHAELPEAQRFMRALCCHQDIASTGAFTVAMLGEFDATLTLTAATVTGCCCAKPGRLARRSIWRPKPLVCAAPALAVFDNTLHGALGLNDARLQTLYHFTVGLPGGGRAGGNHAALPGR